MCYNENPPELHTQPYLEAHVDSLTSGIVKPAVDSIEAVSGLAQGLLCYFEELRGGYTGEVRHNLASNALIHLAMMRVNIFDDMMRRVTLSFAMAYHNDSATSRHRGFSVGKGKSMSDVEKEIDELQCKLTAKTREIEALVAEELNLGDINAMEGTAYARLRSYVEQLIEKWQQANVDHPGSNPDTAVSRLIAEREEIEEQIITLQVR